jgi:hypothetical protein
MSVTYQAECANKHEFARISPGIPKLFQGLDFTRSTVDSIWSSHSRHDQIGSLRSSTACKPAGMLPKTGYGAQKNSKKIDEDISFKTKSH